MRVIVLCTLVSLTMSACLFNTEKDRKVQSSVNTTYGAVLVREIQGNDPNAYIYAEFAQQEESPGAKRVLTRKVVADLRRAPNPCETVSASSSSRDLFDPKFRVSAGELLYGPAANQQLLLKVPSKDNIYLQYLPADFDAELKQVRAKGGTKVGAFSAAFSVPTPLDGVVVNGQEVASESVTIDKKDALIVEWDAPFLVNEDSIMALFLTAKDSFGTRTLKCLEFERLITFGGSTTKEWRIEPEAFADLPADAVAELRLLRGHLVTLNSADKSLSLDIEATRAWNKTVELRF